MADDEFATIDLNALEEVTGGRYTASKQQIKPELIQAIGELAKAITAVGQGKQQADQQKFGQMMQMMGEMMKKKKG